MQTPMPDTQTIRDYEQQLREAYPTAKAVEDIVGDTTKRDQGAMLLGQFNAQFSTDSAEHLAQAWRALAIQIAKLPQPLAALELIIKSVIDARQPDPPKQGGQRKPNRHERRSAKHR